MVSGFITVGRDTAAFESWSRIQPQANGVLCRPLDESTTVVLVTILLASLVLDFWHL